MVFPVNVFGKFRVLAWFVFVCFPLCAVVLGIGAARRRAKGLASILFAAVVVILAVGVDAFLIEPHTLTTSRFTVSSGKIMQRLRIGLITDIQTDRPGKLEQRALRTVAAAAPDLLLLGGDYIQQVDPTRYKNAVQGLRAIFLQAGLHPPLGAFAVPGNVDQPQLWSRIFEGTSIVPVSGRAQVDLGPAVLTALSLQESRRRIRVTGVDKLHIVVGHSPNFSRSEVNADLLLAGHTHGGQVCLPLVGPMLTFSAVPRRWASGMTQIEPGKYLIVSRGLGMERGLAPRLRFLCRPEVVLIDLVPSSMHAEP